MVKKFWENPITVTITDDEFLIPVYEHLKTKSVIVQTSRLTTGGIIEERLIRNREEFDNIKFFPNSKVKVCFDVDIVWDGKIEFETLKPFFDDPKLEVSVMLKGNTKTHPVENIFEYLISNKGVDIVLVKDPKWYKVDLLCVV